MNNIIKNLEKSLENSNRLQDIGSKRNTPSMISKSINYLKNDSLSSIIDYKDMILTKSQELDTFN